MKQNFLRSGVAGVRRGGNYRKDGRENLIRHGLRAMLHHGPFRAAKLRQNLVAERGVGSARALNRSGDSAPADVVRATMIARGRAVSSSSRNFALRIASECSG